MKLITEEVARVKFIVEGKGAQKKMFIEGVFLQGEIRKVVKVAVRGSGKTHISEVQIVGDF